MKRQARVHLAEVTESVALVIERYALRLITNQGCLQPELCDLAIDHSIREELLALADAPA